MHVVIYEGPAWTKFAPLAISRPIFSLMTGMSTLLDKQVRHTSPTRITLWVRPELEELCKIRLCPKFDVPTQVNVPLDDEPALLLNGRTLLFSKYQMPEQDSVWKDVDGYVHAARITDPGLSRDDIVNSTPRWMDKTSLPDMQDQGRLVESIWDLIEWNEESIIEDATSHLRGRPSHTPQGPFHLINERDVWVGNAVSIGPGTVLNATNGPVILADNVSVGANCVIEGPCYIGPHSQVRHLSLIKSGCSFGPTSKIGGEISNSIILGFSNKQHDGFLGDSYLGRWVNLGAGTITSNLKNTYGEINVQIGSQSYPTGRHFLGCLVGDHTKTAIGTRLVCGSYIGYCCMLAGSTIVPKFVPSLSFLTDQGTSPFDLPKAMEVVKRAFARRGRVWSETDQRLMEHIQHTVRKTEQN